MSIERITAEMTLEQMREALEKAGMIRIYDESLPGRAPATADIPEPSPSRISDEFGKLLSDNNEEGQVEAKPDYQNDEYLTLNGYFKVNKGLAAVLKRNVTKSVNTLLLGPTGVGKTELVSNLAEEMNLPITIFDMGTMTDPILSLVGTHIIHVNDGVTSSRFVKSRFSEVIQHPGIVLLDELPRASVAANNLLFPCLDFRRQLSMEYCFGDTTPIKVHPQCVFIATANVGGQYTGSHKLDRALLDRFMLIEIDPLNAKETTDVIKLDCPSINEEVLQKMVETFMQINQGHKDFLISFNLSIRHLKMVAEMIEDGFTLYDSFYIICKGIGGEDGAKALKTLLETGKLVKDED